MQSAEAIPFEKMRVGEKQILDFGNKFFTVHKMTRYGFLVEYLNTDTGKRKNKAMTLADLNKLFIKVE